MAGGASDDGDPWRARWIDRRDVATSVVRSAYREWRTDRTIRLGAGLAYYAVFAVVPVLALSLALAQFIFRRQDVEAYFADLFEGLLGSDSAELAAAVTAELERATSRTGLGIVGIVSLVIAGSLVFVALDDAFKTIWHVPPASGVRTTIRRRLSALVVVVVTGGLFAVALLVQTVVGLLDAVLPDGVEAVQTLVGLLNVLSSFAVLAVAVTLLYRSFSPVSVPWVLAVLAGLLVAVAATVGTSLFGVYLRYVGGASVAGAAGGVLLALLWIYYQVQILLVGAQVLKVLVGRRGSTGAR